MKHIRHFIWDFDGTLVDTYPNLVRYMSLALEDLGKYADPVDILEKMMETIPFAIDYYTNYFSLPELRERFDYHYALGRADSARTFPNVAQVLERICNSGRANYVFTNRGESVYAMLEAAGIREYFTEIVRAGDPNFQYKPAPDSILYLMDKYGGTVDDTVMIGDRKCDLESGYNAGCKTLHLLTPAVPQYPPCDWRIEDYSQMLKLLAE